MDASAETMLDDAIAYEAAERRKLDREIDETRRLVDVLETHAQMHRGTAFGNAIEGLASDYARRLENLDQRRKGMEEDERRGGHPLPSV